MPYYDHTLLFTPGQWNGDGSITFEPPPGLFFFNADWNVEAIDNHTIKCEQRVKIEGTEETTINKYLFHLKNEREFDMELETPSLGKVKGFGVINEKSITWEIAKEHSISGYETYELLEDGGYEFNAEFTSPDQFKTIIVGKIQRDLKSEG